MIRLEINFLLYTRHDLDLGLLIIIINTHLVTMLSVESFKVTHHTAIIRIHRNGRLGKHFPNCDQIARREKKHSRYVPIPPGKDCVHVLLQMRILRIETEAYMLVHLDKVEMHRRVERELVTQSKISLQVNECTEISQSRRNEQLSQRTQLPLVCT